ncbi:MAG: damage-inducible protein CinA [Thermoplasmata archaeon]|nr:MAG: damage-inducible protein CinA [Thermoplasmata archaeon]
MIAEIITVGDELITGNTVDTNATYIAKKLYERGYIVRRITSVGDDVEEIRKAVLEALIREPDILIISGGLGPTHDDVTMYAVSLALGRRLVLSEEALRWIKEKYKELYEKGFVDSPEINEARKKMAYVIEGSCLMRNPVGAAPGVEITHGNTRIYVLPGMPSEMKAILEEHVIPSLGGEPLISKRIKVFSRDESAIADIISSAVSELGIRIHSSPKGFGKDVHIELIVFGKSQEDIEKVISYLRNKGLEFTIIEEK